MLCTLFVLSMMFFCGTLYAGVGDIDNRVNVKWSDYPQIVAFVVKYENEWRSNCTGQYVAPNIILTARHCVVDTSENDGGKSRGKKYKIMRYTHDVTDAVLVEYGDDAKCFISDYRCKDWALLHIEDAAFHSKDYFNVSNQDVSGRLNIRRAGFGWMRILTDAEVRQLRKLVQDEVKDKHLVPMYEDTDTVFVDASQKYYRLNDILDSIWRRVIDAGMPLLWDDEFNLKAQFDCYLFYDNSRSQLQSSCDTWGGDSGSAYWDQNNTIWGTLNGGTDSFRDARNTDILAESGQYYNVLASLREKYSVAVSKLETHGIISVPSPSPSQILLGGIKTEVAPVAPLVVPLVEKTPGNADDSVITPAPELQQQIDVVADQVANDLQNVSGMTDGQFLHLLDKMVAINVLQKQYDAAVAREQSLPNKILGAAAIGLTGIGGMQLASAMAEQSADAAAEQDMQAYLNTFRCDYGDGKTFQGGMREIELPMAPGFAQIYQEYIALAADLKQRKESLGMAPGIESEEIIDSVESGLYDHVGNDVTDGVYTSISRALMDENGADAAAWAQQTQDTSSQKKTGTTLGITGAAGGLIGDLIINRNQEE